MVNMVKKIGYAVWFIIVGVVGCEILVCVVKEMLDEDRREGSCGLARFVRGSSRNGMVVRVDWRSIGIRSVNGISRGVEMKRLVENIISWIYNRVTMSYLAMEFWLKLFDSIELEGAEKWYLDYYLDAVDNNVFWVWDVVGLVRDYIGYVKSENSVNPGYVHNVEIQSVNVKEQGNG